MNNKLITTTVAGLFLAMITLYTPASIAQGMGFDVDAEWAQVPGGEWDGSTTWITSDGMGNIIVLVRVAPYFRMLSRDGTFIKAWDAEVEIDTPHSITVDHENNYWVSDSGDNVIYKFDANGKLLMMLGHVGEAGDNSSQHLFNRPNHVAIAPNGDIYVSDGYVNARVVHYDRTGRFQRIIGGDQGEGPGQLDVVHGVALDSRGRILVNDSDNARVSVFNKEGNFVESWAYPSRGGIEVAADDTVYISDVNVGIVNHVTSSGELIESVMAPRAHGLGIDTDGSIYASGASRMTVMKITKD